MENLVYIYKPKLLTIAKYCVFLLLIISSFSAYKIWIESGFEILEIWIWILFAVFFLVEFIKLTLNIATQKIIFNNNQEILSVIHETKIKKIMVNIYFKDIHSIKLFEINKTTFDLQVALKDGRKFLLFNFGEYVSKTKESMEREKDKVEKYIAIKKNNKVVFFE